MADFTKEALTTCGNMSDINKISEVTVFAGNRKGKYVTVSIYDRGEDYETPEHRFYCRLEQDDGKVRSGNGASSVGKAIDIAGWTSLD